MSAEPAAALAAPTAAGVLMRRATYASIAVAGTMVLVKLAAWLMTGSVSLLSSLLDSLLDAAASLVNLIAIHQALTPADREHRFGHGKAEPLASLGQSAFITGSAVLLIIQGLQHLWTPVPVTNSGIGIAVMVFAIVVTFALVRYQQHIIKRTGSLVVSSDELHYRSDLILNGAVIVSLVVTTVLGWPYVDPLFGIAIGLWIIYGAWRVARKAIVQLMDQELPDEARARIRQIALAHPQVRSVHDLRTRSAGPDAFVQIHLEMDGDLTLKEAHRVSDAVEADILAAFPQAEVMIHQDPEGVEEPRRTFPAR
ncbi:MAG TPA: cation diffusion facilitator family transporter [Stellaceae bacterium]|nr:cation diffusion facilitator family transporter [Stellaceae bacterium]